MSKRKQEKRKARAKRVRKEFARGAEAHRERRRGGGRDVESVVDELSDPGRLAQESERISVEIRAGRALASIRLDAAKVIEAAGALEPIDEDADGGEVLHRAAEAAQAVVDDELRARVSKLFRERSEREKDRDEGRTWLVGSLLTDPEMEVFRAQPNPIWGSLFFESLLEAPLVLFLEAHETAEAARLAAEGELPARFAAWLDEGGLPQKLRGVLPDGSARGLVRRAAGLARPTLELTPAEHAAFWIDAAKRTVDVPYDRWEYQVSPRVLESAEALVERHGPALAERLASGARERLQELAAREDAPPRAAVADLEAILAVGLLEPVRNPCLTLASILGALPGEEGEGEDAMRAAIAHDPLAVDVYVDYAETLGEHDRLDEARALLEEVGDLLGVPALTARLAAARSTH